MTYLGKLMEDLLVLGEFEVQYHVDHDMKLRQYLNDILRIVFD